MNTLQGVFAILMFSFSVASLSNVSVVSPFETYTDSVDNLPTGPPTTIKTEEVYLLEDFESGYQYIEMYVMPNSKMSL